MIYLLIILAMIIIAYYTVFIVYGTKRWEKLSQKTTSTENFLKFSIIIPFRNEEQNIIQCLESLQELNYPQEHYEIIFISDHSFDSSMELINSQVEKFNNLTVLNIPTDQEGKKAAINHGVRSSKYENIITLDADCRVQQNWLLAYNYSLQMNEKKMIIGMVKMNGNSSLFSVFQELDFIAMSGFGAICASYGVPIIANGANLCYKKEEFLAINGFEENEEIPTGDDVFLLHKIKEKYPSQINVLNNSESIVNTNVEDKFSNFFNQKLRWASKTRHYKDAFSLISSIGILLVQIITLLAIIGLFSNRDFIVINATILLGLKLFTDFYFLISFLKLYNRVSAWVYIIPLQIIYPLYILLIAILAQFMDYNWKGRRISN